MINQFNSMLVTMFGIGKIKNIPGTVGSFVTVLVLFIFFHIIKLQPTIIFTLLIIIFLYSFYAIYTHTKNYENKDPREVVIDEFIGQSISIYLYEIFLNNTNNLKEVIFFYLISFFLFRCFDIIKPFPVSFFDKNFKNSFGVIMDDVMAGIYVVITLIFFVIIKSIFVWILY